MKRENSDRLLIGAHTSTAGGLENALYEGSEIGATTVQIFTSNQRQWKGRLLTPEIVDAWNKAKEETGIHIVMSHDSYLINLGAPAEEVLAKSRAAFREEVERCLELGITYLNFHPGAALDGDRQESMDRIAWGLLEIRPLLKNSSLTLLLETTAGQGSSIGYRFEELGYIISKVEGEVPIGVCLDTCHSFSAGYDLRTKEGWDQTLAEFDNAIGLKYLKAFHLNDSMKPFGQRKDRHAPLGKGEIGLKCFEFLMQDPRTRALPKYLETPDGPPLWKVEIQMLREFAKNQII